MIARGVLIYGAAGLLAVSGCGSKAAKPQARANMDMAIADAVPDLSLPVGADLSASVADLATAGDPAPDLATAPPPDLATAPPLDLATVSDLAVPPPPSPKHVFVSSKPYSGKIVSGTLTGLAAADRQCQILAIDSNLSSTNYMAWLSDRTGSPASRFPTHSPGPYVLLDGTVIANSWNQLTSGPLRHAINLTEAKQPSDPFVWTNTDSTGSLSQPSMDCNNWTTDATEASGARGFTTTVSGAWSQGNIPASCDATSPIYCFEQ
jgi:hypothetical protein